ncbi:Hypothetical_protein [Hexamita inflata]|uniref:Hypothetical_protein n=1 Tax=Hexamita inflata TaxID=28002 RepID=A0AA86Q2J6_9EUKA|nr:Hypothetical protein HINF_LOCUS37723 [Hexamita inflata]CAI9956023.1 Hypothetical protein HINF_LOCUS43668 [Hexamita inflata]CAI9958043.1 Hypothetical protein HINF_LOCUS45688 [Hexamita inflata]
MPYIQQNFVDLFLSKTHNIKEGSYFWLTNSGNLEPSSQVVGHFPIFPVQPDLQEMQDAGTVPTLIKKCQTQKVKHYWVGIQFVHLESESQFNQYYVEYSIRSVSLPQKQRKSLKVLITETQEETIHNYPIQALHHYNLGSSEPSPSSQELSFKKLERTFWRYVWFFCFESLIQ